MNETKPVVSAATLRKLRGMHSKLTQRFLEYLTSGKPIRATMIKEIRGFLRDNGITSPPGFEVGILQGMAKSTIGSDEELPFKVEH